MWSSVARCPEFSRNIFVRAMSVALWSADVIRDAAGLVRYFVNVAQVWWDRKKDKSRCLMMSKKVGKGMTGESVETQGKNPRRDGRLKHLLQDRSV